MLSLIILKAREKTYCIEDYLTNCKYTYFWNINMEYGSYELAPILKGVIGNEVLCCE